MRQILNLSYINLPYYLKTCMLYLCVYPEDYTIHKNDLARQWVAEGFICKDHGADPEHVAKCYFNELINRSMIQPTDIDQNGEVRSCKVHDMMLDLILHKSRKENFITVIDEDDIQGMAGHCDKIGRLSLHLDGAKDDKGVGSIQLSQILSPFLLLKHLRVLTIEISGGSWSSAALIDITGICHLFQSRYIKILVCYLCGLLSRTGCGWQQGGKDTVCMIRPTALYVIKNFRRPTTCSPVAPTRCKSGTKSVLR
ncbi:hypothetical protein SEVIR_3G418266v4 [Setaria viridis]